jgi:hypothetical protein
LFVFFGCKADQKCAFIEHDNKLEFNIEIPQSDSYTIASEIVRNGKFVGFVGYNEANHSIDVFEDGQFKGMIKLSFEGPQSIDEIRGVKAYAEDEFIIISRYIIRTVRLTGEILEEVNISTSDATTISGLDMSKYHPTVKPQLGKDFYYDAPTGDLYVPLNNFEYPEQVSIEEFMPGEWFVAIVNVKNGASRYIEVDYPEFLAENLYGSLASVNITFDGKRRMFFGFDGFPDIFIYDLKNKLLQHTANRKPGDNIPPLVNLDDTSGYIEGKNVYENLLFNPIDNKLYQIAFKPGSEKYYDSYLRAFDDEGAFIAEIKIGPTVNVLSNLSASSGIYVQDMLVEEDIIRYVHIEMECEN